MGSVARLQSKVLRATERAERVLPQRTVRKILGLSPTRLAIWKRRLDDCQLHDLSSCPQTQPTQLTSKEVKAIRQLVQSDEHRHMSIRARALHAQRIGKVFASPATWHKLIRERGWLRPRKRLYPAKPKQGVRTDGPGRILHLDLTIIKLLDGKRAYLHAVIDNFSRKILAWHLAQNVEPGSTCRVLEQAAAQLPPLDEDAEVLTDRGSENVNGEFDELLPTLNLHRRLAQVDIIPSNSMIEAWWRSLKHSWLYLHNLDSFNKLHELIAFYVEQHNSVMPHSAFKGQTPDEMFHGTGDQVPALLAEQRKAARVARLETNRSLSCATCNPPPDPPPAVASPPGKAA